MTKPIPDISVSHQPHHNEALRPVGAADGPADAPTQLGGGQLLRQLRHLPELPGPLQGRGQQAGEGGQVRPRQRERASQYYDTSRQTCTERTN